MGRSASTITYSSLSRTNLQLTLTHCCSAVVPTMLLMTPLLIALLLLPDDTTPVSVKQRGAWWGSLPIANRGELSLPGCCPQLADRRLLDLPLHHPIVSAKAAEASKLGEARADVKRLWAASERGTGTIVGGGRSNGGLWIVRGGEVNNCYLDEVKHLGSPPWLAMTKSKRKVIASGARCIDSWSSTHGSKLQPFSDNCYCVRKRGEAYRCVISCSTTHRFELCQQVDSK